MKINPMNLKDLIYEISPFYSKDGFNIHHNLYYIDAINEDLTINQKEKRGNIFNNYLIFECNYHNQTLFLSSLTNDITTPSFELNNAIKDAFGSIENLNSYLEIALADLKDNGSTFLTLDMFNNLNIINTYSYHNPLTFNQIPLLALNKSVNSNTKSLTRLINWEVVSTRYKKAKETRAAKP